MVKVSHVVHTTSVALYPTLISPSLVEIWETFARMSCYLQMTDCLRGLSFIRYRKFSEKLTFPATPLIRMCKCVPTSKKCNFFRKSRVYSEQLFREEPVFSCPWICSRAKVFAKTCENATWPKKDGRYVNKKGMKTLRVNICQKN